jgi:hypothetical protein
MRWLLRYGGPYFDTVKYGGELKNNFTLKVTIVVKKLVLFEHREGKICQGLFISGFRPRTALSV